MTRGRSVRTGSVRPARSGRSRRRQRGAVSAETVMVLPVLVAVALALAWAVSLGVHQVRVIDAAREVARGLARDDAAAQARAVGARVAPPGARISERVEGGRVVVEVVAQVPGPSVLGLRLPSVTLRSEAVSLRESELGSGR